MLTPDRRLTPRFKLRTAMAFNRRTPAPDEEQVTRAKNVSSTGVCFVTSQVMSVGEVIEILMELPQRVTGAKAILRKFTGRIAHINPNPGLPGYSSIGVQLLYGEAFQKPRMRAATAR